MPNKHAILSAPGPHNADYLFDEFLSMVEKA